MSSQLNVVDLDILKPQKVIIKLSGKEIDASYVPLAITFEVDKLVRELADFSDPKVLEEDETAMRRVLDISCELCGLFSSWQHPELTAEWFRSYADVAQVNGFVTVIKETLERAYNGVEAYPGNAEAVEAK